jgi:hypothetical protein
MKKEYHIRDRIFVSNDPRLWISSKLFSEGGNTETPMAAVLKNAAISKVIESKKEGLTDPCRRGGIF